VTDQAGGYLRIERVSKSFPGVRALADVSLSVPRGSVRALIGENGAGKSTLLKILSGVYRPDDGSLFIDDRPQHFRSTSDAIAAGIAVIYQELNLVPHLSVAENLFLGHLPATGGWVDYARLQARSRDLLRELGEDIDPRTKVDRLPIAQRQMVEIAKALSRNATIIAFDEPTSSLSVHEVDRLFAVIRRLRGRGHVVLYVSHRMDEIYEICDSASVLRDGKHIETFGSLANVPRDTLVQRMVGRSVDAVYQYVPRPPGEAMLEVQNLIGPGIESPVSFTVNRGEIVGVFGLVGAGRWELMKLIYGAVRHAAGRVRVAGGAASIDHPSSAIRNGIVFCPEDRKKEGIIPVASVMENINLSARRLFSPMKFIIHEGRERQNASRQVKALGVKTPTLAQKIRNLSGGYQQKAILARWLAEDVKVILLDEPTRGIDVGAKSEIYSIIFKLAGKGVAVVMVSSELPEVMGVCDRVLVMREGVLVGEMRRDDSTPQRIMELALPAAANGLRAAV
jgi:L-arabinose transport system ATP-binding protein